MKLMSLKPIAAVSIAFALTGCGAENYDLSELIKLNDSNIAKWGSNSNPDTTESTPAQEVTSTTESPTNEQTASNEPALTENAVEEEAVANRAVTLDITSQPSNTVIASNTTLNLSLTVSSSDNYDVEWYKNGTLISNSRSFSQANTTTSNSGTYHCVVKSNALTQRCNNFTVSVLDAPKVTSSPTNQFITEGTSATLSIQATGTAIDYQWYKNGSAISGATSASLTLSNTVTSHSGSYKCVVSNDLGSSVSDSANLSVVEAPKNNIAQLSWQQPQSRVDGTALDTNDIKSYRIYYGPTSESGYQNQTDVAGTSNSLEIEHLEKGEYRFAISTIDNDGVESNLTEAILIAIN